MHTRTLTKWLLIAQISAMPLLADTVSNMAESLMKLRAEVETLDASIQDEKDGYKASMKSLVMQKNDLEATIAREDLQIKQLEQELAKVRKEVQEAGKNTEGLKPLLLDAITRLEARIKASLPFKTNERLADLERIKTQLEQDLITPQKALALTWNSYDDAIRMSKENGIFKQTVSLEGKDLLAEVARIGSVMMYFKTPDERVGYVRKSSNGWEYQEELNAKAQEQILALFDAFRKQIRTGYFVLPNAL
jgi:hypothetical protein